MRIILTGGSDGRDWIQDLAEVQIIVSGCVPSSYTEIRERERGHNSQISTLCCLLAIVFSFIFHGGFFIFYVFWMVPFLELQVCFLGRDLSCGWIAHGLSH